jgi:hypothetical protein
MNTRPASSLFFHSLKRIDQVEPRPRHLCRRIDTAFRQSGFHYPQALIEPEPGCTTVSCKHFLLLDRRIEAELKCGVPCHLARSLT